MSPQRRVVTVLFADVVGSTGMAEQLDPEDLQVRGDPQRLEQALQNLAPGRFSAPQAEHRIARRPGLWIAGPV